MVVNNKKLYLKLQNKVIAEFIANQNDDFSISSFKIYDKSLLPFYLREKTELDGSSFPWSFEYAVKNYFKEIKAIEVFRYGYNKFTAQFDQTLFFFRNYITHLRGLSAYDDYWITLDKNEPWEKINPRINELHNECQQLVMKTSAYFFMKDNDLIVTPECNGKGSGKRRWLKKDGKLYLRKYNYKDKYSNLHPSATLSMEISNFLDTLNFEHVKYTEAIEDYKELDLDCIKDPEICCECECFTNDQYSYVPLEELCCYCNDINQNVIDFCLSIDENNFYKQLIINYIIGNHFDPFDMGFLMDNKTGKLVKMAPYFGYSKVYDEKTDFLYFFVNNPSYGLFEEEKQFNKKKMMSMLNELNIKPKNLNNFMKKRYDLLVNILTN